MKKKIIESYLGIKQDISPNKFPDGYYYSALNAKIIPNTTNSTSFSLSNEKTDLLMYSISLPYCYNDGTYNYTVFNLNGSRRFSPKIDGVTSLGIKESNWERLNGVTDDLYTNGLIDINFDSVDFISPVTHVETKDGVVALIFYIISGTPVNALYKLTETNAELLFVGDIGGRVYDSEYEFTTYINDMKYYYENDNVEKIYCTTKDNQVILLNLYTDLTKPNKYDRTLDDMYIVPSITFGDIIATKTSYGSTHTAGMIQYAYSLYNINGQSSTISPISNSLYLTNADGVGAGINQLVGQVNTVYISNLDSNFDAVKVYSIKYNEATDIPVISVITDQKINGSTSLYINDDNTIINNISIEEFIFLGGTILSPSTIELIDNRLIAGNITNLNWDLNKDLDITDSNYFDTRAFKGKDNSSTLGYYINGETASNEIDITDNTYVNSGNIIPYDDDCIAPNHLYKYAYIDGSSNLIYGAKGKYITLELEETSGSNLNILKGGETYRFGIRFINSKGIKSSANWICDLEIPYTNLIDNTFYKVILTITSAGKTILQNQDVVRFELLRVERTNADKTILCQGIPVPMIFQVRDNDIADADMIDNATSTTFPYSDPTGYYTKAFTNREILSKNYVKYPSIIPRTTASIVKNFSTNIEDYCEYKLIHHLTDLSLPAVTGASKVQITNILNRDSVYYNNYTTDSYLDNSISYGTDRAASEIAGATDGSYTNRSFMYTKMWQIYSPDIKFNLSDVSVGNKIRIIGAYTLGGTLLMVSTPSGGGRATPIRSTAAIATLSSKAKNYVIDTSIIKKYTENKNLLFQFDVTDGFHSGTGPGALGGFIVDSGNTERVDKYHYYISADDNSLYYNNYANETYSSSYTDYREFTDYDIYGIPEVVDGNIGNTSYNNNTDLRFSTSLRGITSDNLECTSVHADCERSAVVVPKFSTNVNYNSTITSDSDLINHVRLEEAIYRVFNGYSQTDPIFDDGLGLDACILPVVEIIRTNVNQYGGNTFEARSRNKYITVGISQDINIASFIEVEQAGDVFKTHYKSQIIGNQNSDNLNSSLSSTPMIATSIDFKLETSCNLDARYDLSKDDIYDHFLPEPDNYNIYNSVYNRESNIFISTPLDFRITNTDLQNTTLLRASKPKIPGEIIDSFTDFLTNEELLLDGKYGSIIKLHNHKDVLFSFQEKAVSVISVNPRVQIVGDDGIQTELGTGRVLDDKNYINVHSGLKEIDKASVLSSPRTLYYFDRNNTSLYYFNGDTTADLALEKGCSKFFKTSTESIYNSIKDISCAYDFQNKELIFTGSTDLSLKFSELLNEFHTRLLTPNNSRYFNIDNTLHNITRGTNAFNIYKTYKGSSYLPLQITFVVNPENGIGDCRFDNISWITSNSNNFTGLKITNDYQDTDVITFATADNLYKPKQKFRRWSVPTPRDKVNTKDRIRSSYIYLTLYYSGSNELNVGDIIISYNI